MHIVHHAQIRSTGSSVNHSTLLAGRSMGLEAFEILLLTLAPGAITPPQTHAGELVVLAMGGAGRLLIDGGQQRFGGNCTLLIPPHRLFQVGSFGTAALQTFWIYTRLPAPLDGNADP